MTVKTYRARTVEDALLKVKADLGPDALILETKANSSGSISDVLRDRHVEIVAAGPASTAGQTAPQLDDELAEAQVPVPCIPAPPAPGP